MEIKKSEGKGIEEKWEKIAGRIRIPLKETEEQRKREEKKAG